MLPRQTLRKANNNEPCAKGSWLVWLGASGVGVVHSAFPLSDASPYAHPGNPGVAWTTSDIWVFIWRR